MKKISTIEALGNLVQSHHHENTQSFTSIGDHLVKIEARLEDVPTRGEIGEILAKAYDYAALEARVEVLEKRTGVRP